MLGSRLGDDGFMRPFTGHFIPLFLLAVLLVAGLSWAEEITAPPAPTAEEQAIAEADRLLAGQNWQAAAEAARPLTNATNPGAIRLAGFERLAVALAGTGSAEESEQAARQAETLFRELEQARLAKSGVYFRNRFDLDGMCRYAIGLQRKCQAAARAAGHGGQTAPAAVGLARRFPDHPHRHLFALEAGEQLLALGNEEAAVPWFVAALDPGLDRSFVAKAKLGENQVQLDAVAKPLPLDTVERAFAGLAAGPGAADFHAALALTRLPDDRAAVQTLESFLVDPATDRRAAALARLELARTHLRVGHAPEARAALAAIEPERDGFLRRRPTAFGTAVAAHRDYLLGICAGLDREHKTAAGYFAKAAELGGEAFAKRARFEQARSLELAGAWENARSLYRQLAEDSPAESTRRTARIALARLDDYGDASLVRGTALVQLPDDRETFGDWYLGYGGEQYILCAHNYRVDVKGGPGPEVKLAFSTTDPKEPSRLWVTAPTSEDPATLWNPRRRTRFPANRDDKGERYPVGEGPDLIMDTAVPEGRHILTLYFLNDHRFYESNRRYTVEIRSGDTLVGLADARDFGGGLYLRHLVAGPARLRVRLRRDASMNVLLHGVFLDPVPDLPAAFAEGEGPLPAAASGTPYAQCAARLERQPADLLARPAALLALAGELLSQPPESGNRFLAAHLLQAGGRPRTARRAFAEHVDSLPPGQLLPAARALARRMQARDPFLSRRTLDWPEGTHPLDLLAERWFAAHCADREPDGETLAVLLALFRGAEPHATPFARTRALAELDRHAPESLTPSLVRYAGTKFKSEGEAIRAAELFRRALAANPDPHTELHASFNLLDVAPQAGLSLAEARALHARILELGADGKADYLLPAAHLHLAHVLADHNHIEEAILALEHAPPANAAALRRDFQRRLDMQKKERVQ
jgi:tetratricopeptide (TPR) repeat protein